MPKHHPKQHPQGEGIALVGNPAELIYLLIKDPKERGYVLNHVTGEGPKHKQVLSALLLKRVYRLLRAIEKSNDASFELQEGYQFSIEEEGGIVMLPLTMPLNTGSGFDPQKIADAVAHAPEHELLVYTMCLQVIEWAIKVTRKKNIADN